jgi:hypothetical protein
VLDELEPAVSDERGFRPLTELVLWPLGAAVVVALGAALFGFAGARFQWSRLALGFAQRGLSRG